MMHKTSDTPEFAAFPVLWLNAGVAKFKFRRESRLRFANKQPVCEKPVRVASQFPT